MNPLRICFVMSLGVFFRVSADIAVTFQNNVFTPSRLVTFGFGTGDLAGTGVRNGVFQNVSFVAQLYQVVGKNEIPIGPRANFRAAATDRGGTWSGGSRTIPGVNPGEVVYLRVKAWDASADSYECAAGHHLLRGASDVFSYAQPAVVLHPWDTYMANFRGFEIYVPLTPCWFLVPSHNPTTAENTPVELSYSAVPPESMFGSYLQAASTANQREGKKLGEVALTGGVISYTPTSNSYGEEKFWGVFCCDFVVAFTTVTIEPSVKRPYLALTPGDTIVQQRLVLRGLALRRYRVEQSENLTAWEPVGEFTANFSEVPVQDLSPLSATARFFRAVDVSPQ